ncbi:MAG: hypothetical protein CMM07_13995 [Rhodopirellula sp.]|nr:hypothetical protein [Rhodopirellula sp.]
MNEFLNQIWRQSCRKEARKFQFAIRDPLASQAETLMRQLRVLAPSHWGNHWRLSSITSVEDFQKRVPITHYEDYRTAIAQIDQTGDNPLTAQRVEMLEPTTGTSSQPKWIPYTRALHREFQAALAVWVYDLFTQRPATMRGTAYWSVSPPLQDSSISESGIPKGFDDDAAYLGFFSRQVARRLLSVPSDVKQYTQPDDWRYATLWYLLQDSRLAFISVWSPTFLLELIAFGNGGSRERLARDIHDGICRLSGGQQIRLPRKHSVFSPRNRRQVAELLERPLNLQSLSPQIWPALSVISCWADSSSKRYITKLSEYFPHAEISPKGLLSTEACISIPLINESGAALALRSHFMEFMTHDSGEPFLAHQLEAGQRYQVVVTTGGGLYRYQTGDWIEVTGFLHACPLVRFLGRDATSDLVGEKLTDQFVQQVIEKLLTDIQPAEIFAMLVPDEKSKRYCLFLAVDREPLHDRQGNEPCDLANRLEQLLCENIYYHQARQLGQLDSATIIRERSEDCFLERYQQLSRRHGIREGDMKLVALETNPAKARDFLADD